jgi:GrpB-like predicted nucleotidyltransferase (UPF0157 family)
MSASLDPPREIIAVELAAPNPAWVERARAETAWLTAALGEILITVHHIGSTAIPGIKAKPIVDLLPVVRSLAELDAKHGVIEAIGYQWRGEFGLPGRRYCPLNDPETGKRVVQLHFYQEGDPQIARHLNFRDYLRAHPDQARAYEAEKLRAAAVRPDDTLAYNAEKNDWIAAADIRAAAWAKSR